MIAWLKFLWRTRNCPHQQLRGVYGDEINAVGGLRLKCLDCGKYLDGPLTLVAQRPYTG